VWLVVLWESHVNGAVERGHLNPAWGSRQENIFGYLSSFLNPGRLAASIISVVSDGFTGSRSVSLTSKISLRAYHSSRTRSGINSLCVFPRGKARVIEFLTPSLHALERTPPKLDITVNF
jgi:hypothetical protein